MWFFKRPRTKQSAYDITLLTCPTWGALHPPLGLAYLWEALTNAGLTVSIVDLNILLFHHLRAKGLEWVWSGATRGRLTREEEANLLFKEGQELIERTVEQIVSDAAPVIGFSLISERSWILSLLVAAEIKRRAKSSLILFGGNASDELSRHIDQREFVVRHKRWNELQGKVVDLVVTGEGELVLPQLVTNYLRQQPLNTDLPATIINHEPNPLIAAPPIADLDSIAFPTYRGFHLSQYGDFMQTQKGLPTTARQFQFLFSRGCINRCSFCNENLYSGPYRCRSAANALTEMQYHVATYGATHFECNDLILNGNLKRLLDLCDAISANGLDVKWTGLFWVSSSLQRETFDRMYRSGLTAVHFGLESGSTRVLNLMRKRYDADTAARVLRAAKEAGMWVSVNLIAGFPGETEADFNLTLDFLRTNREFIDAIMNLSTCEIDKGMALLNEPEKFGLLSLEGDRWEDSVGNTFETRLQKAHRLRAVARELDLPIYIDNTGLKW